ncbi:MAG: PIN-like domain-containing protein [Oceanicaulis sp.]
MVGRRSSVIGERAFVRFAPRNVFLEIASHRNATKTPPGFKDDGDGDFFVWVDLLYSIKVLSAEYSFSSVLLVTNEKKKDWTRDGIIHPVMRAEVKALINKPIRLLGFPDFRAEIKKLVEAD